MDFRSGRGPRPSVDPNSVPWAAVDGGDRPVGVLVLEARRLSGLSQRELARRSGVSRTTVVEIEAGRRDPSVGTLKAVLSAAGFDLELQLVLHDEHDRELEDALAGLGVDERIELRTNLDRFV